MLKRFMTWLGRYRVIMDRTNSEPYLERYYLFLKDRTNFPFNIFIHKFCKSDPDDLHDHPWAYMTLILKGGYWEHTPQGKFWRGPGSLRFRKAEDLHWLELAKDKDGKNIPCWSLFYMAKKRKDWGFKVDGKWIQHEEYLNKKEVRPEPTRYGTWEVKGREIDF